MDGDDQGLVPETENRPAYSQLRTTFGGELSPSPQSAPHGHTSIHNLTHTLFYGNFESATLADKSLFSALADDPSLASEVLDDAQNAALDSNFEVRSTAMRVAGSLLRKQMPNVVRGVLDLLKRGATDNSAYVRYNAIDEMNWVVWSQPKMGEEVFNEVKKSLSDRDPYVPIAALHTLGEVAYQRPDLADSVLDLAQKAFSDRNNNHWIRSAALGTLSDVAQGRADLAPSAVQIAQQASADSSADVRSSAQTALIGVARSRPELALELALKGTTDGDKDVRDGGLAVLAEIVRHKKELAEPVLKAAENALSDPDHFVRENARSLLTEIKDYRPDLFGKKALPSAAVIGTAKASQQQESQAGPRSRPVIGSPVF